MVAQNEKNCNDSRRVERQLPDVHAQVDTLEQWVEQSARNGIAAHEVERGLFDKLLALGKSLFGGFLKLVGPGDFGESMPLDDGRLVHRSAELHERRLKTVFGEFTLARWVYAQREGARFEFMPTDQRLQLPASEVSYLLQEWDQLLGIEHAFGKVREVMETILRLPQSVDTLEHTNQQMAEAAPVFRDSQGPVNLATEGKLLVVTEDNKGIPMVRPVEEKPAGAHRSKGEKANKKQMACIGCVYSVDPHLRTAEELVATLFRDPDRPKVQPPKAQNKRYWAELSRDLDGEAIRGQDLVFAPAGGNQAASPAWTVAGASVGRASVVGHGSANVLAGGRMDPGHSRLDARAAACMGSSPHVPPGKEQGGNVVRARAADADPPGPGRQSHRRVTANGSRITSGQEETAARDLRLPGEKQAAHALRRILANGLPNCDGSDRRSLPPRNQRPDGTSGHALESTWSPSDVEPAHDLYQRRLDHLPGLSHRPGERMAIPQQKSV